MSGMSSSSSVPSARPSTRTSARSATASERERALNWRELLQEGSSTDRAQYFENRALQEIIARRRREGREQPTAQGSSTDRAENRALQEIIARRRREGREQPTAQETSKPGEGREGGREGEGVPYLHGSLEVRLLLADDGKRLLARVCTVGAGVNGGRMLELEDFVSRAEAIEAQRAKRPVPIAEEAETQNSPGAPPLAGAGSSEAAVPSTLAGAPPGHPQSLRAAILGQGTEKTPGNSAAAPSGSNAPWKNLFKSHWTGSGRGLSNSQLFGGQSG
eukprot:TRINITY_DN1211_c2_g1_i4.p1 TRINITY_DN1211_c2_g1~~TRINITY_DN1211_c2_g1_i4.p1  ORF type:complete len:276 (-),score=49.36 TRINITY_DN1211_c2_g1_i4:93-920(-)